MQSLPLCLAASVGSAAFFAGSTALQYEAINTIENSIDAIKSHAWLAGIVCNVFAIGLQSLALLFGPLATVQVTLLVGIVIVFPISALLGKRRLQTSDIAWSVAVVLLLAVFLLAASPSGGSSHLSTLALTVIYSSYAAGLVVAFLLHNFINRHAAVAFGAIAGSSYALAAALFQAFNDSGNSTAERVLVAALLILTVAVGFVFNQLAFKRGAINGAATAISVSNPIVSTAVGFTAFHELFGTSDATRLIAIVSLVFLLVTSAKLSSNGTSSANN